jgi:glycosyltransferase involved in cell wall biosynthesis
MSNIPLVSIVMPSYNQAPYLADACHSVARQDYPNIEFIIIDGASTDGSVEIINTLSSDPANRISFFVSEKDSGQAEAINKGFARANGEIIAWLNSDDLYMLGAVSKAVDIFSKNPQVGLVFSNVFSIDAKSQLINTMRFGKRGLRELLAFNIISQPGVFFKRSVLDRSGWLDPSYHFLLDQHLWLRIANFTETHYVDDYFAAARFHAQAKNVAKAEFFGEEVFRILDWVKNEPDFSRLFDQNKKEILSGAWRLSARYLLDGGLPGKAFCQYMRSLIYHPSTALAEKNRILYAAFSALPLAKLGKTFYFDKRKKQLIRDKMDEIYRELSGQ